jgi:PhnB protein
MKTTLVPYLNFDGRTSEAMKFYHSVLGGELKMQTFAEAGMAEKSELGNRIMHADLKTDTVSMMASDTHSDHSQPLMAGNNINLSLIGTDEATLSEYFNKLAEGGQIVMPLEKQFWGDLYGMLIDKFGIPWMVNISPEQK